MDIALIIEKKFPEWNSAVLINKTTSWFDAEQYLSEKKLEYRTIIHTDGRYYLFQNRDDAIIFKLEFELN